MPKFTQISGKQMIKALRKAGFVVIGQEGSHIKMRKMTHTKITIIVPNHKIIRPGTFKNILKTADLTRSEFDELS